MVRPPEPQRSILQWSLLTCFFLVDGIEASAYCLGGGQLVGVIFGTILGTVAVLAAVFLAFVYLRANRAKECPSKHAQLDVIDNRIRHSIANVSKSGTSHDAGARCPTCHRLRYDGAKDEGDHRNKRHDVAIEHTATIAEKDKLPNNRLGNGIDNITPRRFSQNSISDRSGSEYRTKKKRNSVFSSWWTQHTASKRRMSHSTESLNSVNEVVRVLLTSCDVNGLGFNICGNVRDGIFVRSLSNRGPAKESGVMREGDRILSVTVNFENIVFEDALTIISYASAYPVCLELQRAETVSPRKHADTVGDIPLMGTKIFLNSDKSSTARSTRVAFHPLFKSQSIEDVSSFRSTSPAVYSHIFDAIDASLEAQKAKTISYCSIGNGLVGGSGASKPKQVLCSLEVIEETPQLHRRSPAAPRKLLDDNQSLASTSSSLDMHPASNRGAGDPSSTTITVTAEINAVNCREGGITINDSYVGLSHEERLQIIRLSYEDADLSRGTPTSHQARSESQIAEDPSQKVLENFIKSPSPTLGSLLDSVEEKLRRDGSYQLLESARLGYQDEQNIDRICGINVHYIEATSTEDDGLSIGEGPSSLESSTTEHRTEEHQDIFPAEVVPSKQRLKSLTSPSGSSIDASGSESDRFSSPEQSKRDSGYDANGNEEEIEKEQYEKLLYFQRQLAKQHEELARLGIDIPMPSSGSQQTVIGPKKKPRNGHYTSA